MSGISEIEFRQTDAPSKAEEQPITAAEMLNQLIAGGHIVTPVSGYSQPTIPSAYRIVPTITADHSIPTSLRPEPG